MHHVVITHDGPLATLTLNRPDKLNALSLEMLEEIRSAVQTIAASDTRCVVLRGAGDSFCVGVDIETLRSDLMFQADPELRYKAARLGGDVALAIEAMPQATIAALHGHVVGGGVVMAAACDLRVADPDTTFSIPEIDLGIPLAWGGIPRLVREIGPMRTKELVMTARSFTAKEASTVGFITRVSDKGAAFDEATELAWSIADKPRFGIATTKRHVAEVVAGDTSRDDALGLVASIEDRESSEHRRVYLELFD